MNHTEGEWTLFGQREDEMGLFVEAADGTKIATIESGNLADANLVVAAPYLLAALVDLLECDVEISGGDAAECRKAARAAVAKARGQ